MGFALGWVRADGAVAAVHGVAGVCWAMQFGTFGLFELRALLRAGKPATTYAPGQTRGPRGAGQLGPNPARSSRRDGLLRRHDCDISPVIHADLVHDGGILHEFLERPGATPVIPHPAAPRCRAAGTVLGVPAAVEESGGTIAPFLPTYTDMTSLGSFDASD